MAHYTVTIK